jgi:hypothetical protein
MDIAIGAYDPATRSVPVTFTAPGPDGTPVVHARPVNAVLKQDGAFDPGATEVRVGEVARGVEVKISIGAIGNPPPPPATDEMPAEEPADAPAAE